MNQVIYLDHHSTTPVAPEVFEDMKPFFMERFGNPASQNHVYGWTADQAVETARNQVAQLLNCQSKEITFTSGATECNALALVGVFETYRENGRHIITSEVEHKSILETCKLLEKQGAEVTYLQPDRFGQIQPEQVKNVLRDDTILVSLIFGNNEVGTLNPIGRITDLLKDHPAFFHTDAVQAVGRVPIDVSALGIDLLSISAHKIYGPKGVGALFIRRRSPRIRLSPLLVGGGQETGLRAGTLNVPGIVGMGSATALMKRELPTETPRLSELRDQFISEVETRIGRVRLNGHPSERLCHNVSLTFDGLEGDSLIADLVKVVAVSTGSACATNTLSPSHVLKAIGLADGEAATTLRFGLGRGTTQDELERVVTHLEQIVRKRRIKT
jgi:cysteine desulfurase